MFVPEPDVLLAFVLAALALNVTPGADMVFVLGTSLQHRTRAGVLAALGIAAGSLCHAVLAAAGLSALVAASPTAMAVVTSAGAAYLVWVGVRMVRDDSPLVVPAGHAPAEPAALSAAASGPSHPAPLDRPAPPGALRLVGRGATVNLLNVKVVLFFLSFIPLFVRPGDGPVWQQVLLFGLLFDVLGTIVLVGVAVAAGGASRTLADRPGVVVTVRRACGALLVVLAVVLVVTRLPA
ncbi:LysE family translocator [Cellulomonas sp. URHB0016]